MFLKVPIGKNLSKPNPASEETQSTGEGAAPTSPTSIVEAELIERFGEHRVRHSRRIATKIVSLNQRIAETDGETNLRMRIIKLMEERDPSTLNPSDFDFEELNPQEVTKVDSGTLDQLKENPLPLQQILLIRDARNRDAITETEFRELFTQLSKEIPKGLSGIGDNSTSLEDAEKHIEKLVNAIN